MNDMLVIKLDTILNHSIIEKSVQQFVLRCLEI